MSIEDEFSGDDQKNTSDSHENNRNLLYRYEYEGVLVYDSNARISDEPIELVPQLKFKKPSKFLKPRHKQEDYGKVY
jgi:hypothetical protein